MRRQIEGAPRAGDSFSNAKTARGNSKSRPRDGDPKFLLGHFFSSLVQETGTKTPLTAVLVTTSQEPPTSGRYEGMSELWDGTCGAPLRALKGGRGTESLGVCKSHSARKAFVSVGPRESCEQREGVFTARGRGEAPTISRRCDCSAPTSALC